MSEKSTETVKRLVILYGIPGSGKSFLGSSYPEYRNKLNKLDEKSSSGLSYSFLEGDLFLPTKWCELLYFYFSKDGVFNFVRDKLIPAINLKLQSCQCLIVSQALFFEEHRQYIKNYFEKNSTNVVFVRIAVGRSVQKANLIKRNDSMFNKVYHYFTSLLFEQNKYDLTIDNSTDKALAQLDEICQQSQQSQQSQKSQSQNTQDSKK